MFERLSSGGPSHWPHSILGRSGMAVVVLGGAFHFVGYGPWTLLCMVGGALLISVFRGTNCRRVYILATLFERLLSTAR